MRTLLVLTKQPSLAAALQSVLEPSRFQLITKEDVADAEILLSRGAIDATILDAELTDVKAIRIIEQVKQFAPGGPLIVYAGVKQWEWEEDAYLLGVEHVLAKPVRGKLLNNLLSRLFPEREPDKPLALASAPLNEASVNGGGRSYIDQVRALEAFRRFSALLMHGLDATALLKQFLMLLREIMGVNRAIIFLRRPAGVLSDNPLSPDDRWLRSSCAIGLDQSVLQHFALSLGAGIGGHLHRHGRILRANSYEAQTSREITKEFQLLGAQVAIPILDRESLLGVALFDERLTGEPYGNEELALTFHMLEEVGLAIRNSWLYEQLQANCAMIADILGHLGSGCVVIGNQLGTLHANLAAGQFFLHDRPGKTALEFSDLPQALGSMVFTVIKTGLPVAAFNYQFPHSPDLYCRVSITPFRMRNATTTSAALLIIEDITEHERAKRLEIESANLRLVRSMAEHLAHEIGNSLVPLSTHQQLLKDSIDDPEFQVSLSLALSGGVKRISRLASQMMFLAREWQVEFRDEVTINDLIVEAFHEAHTFQPGKKLAQLSFAGKDLTRWKMNGDHKALRHAFSEIMLNALQANPDDPSVEVRLSESDDGVTQLQVEVRDKGHGFTAEAAKRAPEPFFSTRSVGIGLGLTVSTKIIESHRGTIEIPASSDGARGVVRISLPVHEMTGS